MRALQSRLMGDGAQKLRFSGGYMITYDDELQTLLDEEEARQKSVLRLIPSENIVSDGVREALGVSQ